MAGLRRVLDHSFVLVHGASAGACLAQGGAFPIPSAGSGMDLDVGWCGRAHWTVASCHPVLDSMDVVSCGPAFSEWISSVLAFGCQLQPGSPGGLPEVRSNHREHRLVTSGIRAHVRHPVYLGHLCEMLAWSLGTGLIVCWLLTGFAMATGTVMIRMEDAELARRFGQDYVSYRDRVGAVIPRLRA